MVDLILASRSPRRVELLKQINVSCRSMSGDVVEIINEGEDARHYVSRMALSKTLAVEAIKADLPTLGADTTVVVNDEILGKPKNQGDGIDMLMKLSAQTHRVITGVAIKKGDQLETIIAETLVTFRKLNMEECRSYWQTGEPADKAGAYGIQGRGAVFVSSVNGSYSNVAGLPLMETAQALNNFGINSLAPWRARKTF